MHFLQTCRTGDRAVDQGAGRRCAERAGAAGAAAGEFRAEAVAGRRSLAAEQPGNGESSSAPKARTNTHEYTAPPPSSPPPITHHPPPPTIATTHHLPLTTIATTRTHHPPPTIAIDTPTTTTKLIITFHYPQPSISSSPIMCHGLPHHAAMPLAFTSRWVGQAVTPDNTCCCFATAGTPSRRYTRVGARCAARQAAGGKAPLVVWELALQ